MVMRSRADSMLIEAVGGQPRLDWFDRCYLHAQTLPSIRAVAAARSATGDISWGMLCIIHNIYQLWTLESIHCLRAALQQSRAHRILEVGAGDGRLTQALRSEAPAFTIVGQDDGSWAATHHTGPVVTELRSESIAESLMAVQPDTVIVSWMPYEEDWTPLFRACPSVQQYWVIGEDAGGCTGTEHVFYPPAPWRIEELSSFQPVAAGRTDPSFGSMTHCWRIWRSAALY